MDSNDENLIANGTLTTYSVQDEDNNSVQLSKTSDNMIIVENVGAYNGTKSINSFLILKT